MGVAGLTAYVEARGASRPIDLAEEGRRLAAERASPPPPGLRPPSNEIVLDGMGLLRTLYRPQIDWVRGGQFERLAAEVAAFAGKFQEAGFQLTVIFDGQVENQKRKVWVSRRLAEVRRAEQIMDYIAEQERLPPADQNLPERKLWFLPISSTRSIPNAFKDAGCKVFFSLSEADREIAAYAIENNAFAVLGDDSDYLVFDLPRILSARNLRGLRTTVIDRESKLAVFPGLHAGYWGLLATLAGNDYGRRFESLASFILGDDEQIQSDTDEFFARAAAFIVERIQSQGILPDNLDGIVDALLRHSRRDMRRYRDPDQTAIKRMKHRLWSSLSQYSFDGIRDTVDTHLVPPALRQPALWERILTMHRESQMDYECLSVLTKRTVNFGAVVEKAGVAGMPTSWEIAGGVLRRAYGVLLGDARDALPSEFAKPMRKAAAATPATKPSFVDPAVVFALPSSSPARSSSASNSLLADIPAAEDDGIDEEGFRDSVAQLAGLVGDDDGLAGLSLDPAPGEEPEGEDFDEGEDDLEREAQELLAQAGGVDEDDDDLSTVAEEEAERGVLEVVEWVMSTGVPFERPAKVEPTFEIDGQPVPTFSQMLAADPESRLAGFLFCAGAPRGFSLPPHAPPVLTAVCLALRRMLAHPNLSKIVRPVELQALLAQACSQAVKSANYKGRSAGAALASEVPLSVRATQLGTIFLRTMVGLSMLNDACCRPLGDNLCRSWKFFDGVMYHRRLVKAQQTAGDGPVPAEALLDRASELGAFRACWRAVTAGTPWAYTTSYGRNSPMNRNSPSSRGRGGMGQRQFSSETRSPGGLRQESPNPLRRPDRAPVVSPAPVRKEPPRQSQSPAVETKSSSKVIGGFVVQKTYSSSSDTPLSQPAIPEPPAASAPKTKERGPRAPPKTYSAPPAAPAAAVDHIQTTLEAVKAKIDKQKAGGERRGSEKRPAGQSAAPSSESKQNGRRRSEKPTGKPANGQASPANGQGSNERPTVCPHYAAGSCSKGLECPLPHVAGVQRPVRKPVS